jgi:hypothetical protein
MVILLLVVVGRSQSQQLQRHFQLVGSVGGSWVLGSHRKVRFTLERKPQFCTEKGVDKAVAQ